MKSLHYSIAHWNEPGAVLTCGIKLEPLRAGTMLGDAGGWWQTWDRGATSWHAQKIFLSISRGSLPCRGQQEVVLIYIHNKTKNKGISGHQNVLGTE